MKTFVYKHDATSSFSKRFKTIQDCVKLFHPIDEFTVGTIPSFEEDVFILGRHWRPEDLSFLVYSGKKSGIKIVFDIEADFFDTAIGPFYEWMVEQSDLVTCPTPGLQERIYEVTGKLAQIIPTPNPEDTTTRFSPKQVTELWAKVLKHLKEGQQD